MRWFKRKATVPATPAAPAEPQLLAAQDGAELWLHPYGRKTCKCPFLCIAASEPCEFKGSKWDV